MPAGNLRHGARTRPSELMSGDAGEEIDKSPHRVTAMVHQRNRMRLMPGVGHLARTESSSGTAKMDKFYHKTTTCASHRLSTHRDVMSRCLRHLSVAMCPSRPSGTSRAPEL